MTNEIIRETSITFFTALCKGTGTAQFLEAGPDGRLVGACYVCRQSRDMRTKKSIIDSDGYMAAHLHLFTCAVAAHVYEELGDWKAVTPLMAAHKDHGAGRIGSLPFCPWCVEDECTAVPCRHAEAMQS